MSEPTPNPQLLSALGRLVRGLSALFWGLPITLLVCVQTAKGEWLRPMGILPPVLSTGLLFYGLQMLSHFQKQERVWQVALDRAMLVGIINIGLSPFLFWWNKMPGNLFYISMIQVMIISGLTFLYVLNPLLARLVAMLPDETLRLETRMFTTLNRYLIVVTIIFFVVYFALARVHGFPLQMLGLITFMEDRGGLWIVLFLILLPVAMTMALTWKIKEVILAGVFGGEEEN